MTPDPRHNAALKSSWRIPCLIGMVAAAPYLATLGYRFTNWDDPVILTHNPAVRQFNPAGLTRAIARPAGRAFMPTRLLLHMLEYRLWGLEPAGYHAVNVLLNSLACIMLWLFVAPIAGRRVAIAGVLLYALHPAHVEAVAWVSGRKEVLSAFLMFAAGAVFVRDEVRARLGLAASCSIVALAVAAMFAKPTAVMLPGLLFAAKLRMGALDRRHAGGTVLIGLLLVLAVAAAAVHVEVGAAYGVLKPQHGGSRLENARFAAHAFAEHARICAFPVRLAIRYMPRAAGPARLAAALAGAAWLVAVCVRAARRRRVSVPGLCILWFCIALAPSSTLLFPTSTTVADRYVFVASFGACLLAAWAANRVARARLARWGIGLSAVSLTVLTLQRCPSWADDGALWRQAVVDSPEVAGLHISLAAHYADAHLYRRAKGEIVRVLGADTRLPRAVHNLAVAEHRLGHDDAALRLFRKAVELQGAESPAAAPSYNGIGVVLRKRGDLANAVAMFQRALGLRPGLRVAQSNLADALAKQGRVGEAIDAYERLLATWPDDPAGHFELARLLYARREHGRALRHLLRARALGFDSAACEAYAGLCHLELGHMSSAKRCLAAAMALDEHRWEPHLLAGRIAEAMGDLATARLGYQHALKYNPQAIEPKRRLEALRRAP